MSSPSPRGIRKTEAGQPHTRRANACIPCRRSKSKCDGGTPCKTCTMKRGKPVCVYANRSAESDSGDFDASLEDAASPKETEHVSQPKSVSRRQVGADEGINTEIFGFHDDGVFGSFCVCHSIDEFKMLLPTGSMPWTEAIDRLRGAEAFQLPPDDASYASNPVLATTSPKTTRARGSYFYLDDLPRPMPPYLVKLNEEVISTQILVQEGNLIDAWLLLPTLVRRAEYYGLDPATTSYRPMSYVLEAEVRLRLWWKILELDSQLSFHLGRSLIVRPVHGISRPTLNDLLDDQRAVEQSKLDFRQYVLDVIYSMTPRESRTTRDQKGVISLLQTHLSRLQRLQRRIPQLPRNHGSDIHLSIAIADHQLETFVFSLVIYCHLAWCRLATLSPQRQFESSTAQTALDTRDRSHSQRDGRLRSSHRSRTYEYQKEILQSARDVLDRFELVHQIDPAEAAYKWTRCFGAYCALSILAVAKLRQETELDADYDLVRRVTDIFAQLLAQNPNSALLHLATRRSRDLVATLDLSQPAVLGGQTSAPLESNADIRFHQEQENLSKTVTEVSKPGESIDQVSSTRKRPSVVPEDSLSAHNKRQRLQYGHLGDESHPSMEVYNWLPDNQNLMPHPHQSSIDMQTSDYTASGTLAAYADGYNTPYPGSTSTSFHESDQMPYTGLPYASSEGFESGIIQFDPRFVHPPMLPHPPMNYWTTSQTQNMGMNQAINHPPPVPDTTRYSLSGHPHGTDLYEQRSSTVSHALSPEDDRMILDQSTSKVNPYSSAQPIRVTPRPSSDFYSTGTPDYRETEPPTISPTSTRRGSRQEPAHFMASASSSRRQSIMDIPQQQQQQQQQQHPANLWAMETTDHYGNIRHNTSPNMAYDVRNVTNSPQHFNASSKRANAAMESMPGSIKSISPGVSKQSERARRDYEDQMLLHGVQHESLNPAKTNMHVRPPDQESIAVPVTIGEMMPFPPNLEPSGAPGPIWTESHQKPLRTDFKQAPYSSMNAQMASEHEMQKQQQMQHPILTTGPYEGNHHPQSWYPY